MMAGPPYLTSSFVVSVDLSQDFCPLKIMFFLHDICKSAAEAYLECSMWEALSIPVSCAISVQKGKVHWSPRF